MQYEYYYILVEITNNFCSFDVYPREKRRLQFRQLCRDETFDFGRNYGCYSLKQNTREQLRAPIMTRFANILMGETVGKLCRPVKHTSRKVLIVCVVTQ